MANALSSPSLHTSAISAACGDCAKADTLPWVGNPLCVFDAFTAASVALSVQRSTVVSRSTTLPVRRRMRWSPTSPRYALGSPMKLAARSSPYKSGPCRTNFRSPAMESCFRRQTDSPPVLAKYDGTSCASVSSGCLWSPLLYPCAFFWRAWRRHRSMCPNASHAAATVAAS